MKSEVIYCYAIDVVNEVVISRVQSQLGQKPTPLRLPVGRGIPKGNPFHHPPAV